MIGDNDGDDGNIDDRNDKEINSIDGGDRLIVLMTEAMTAVMITR